MSRRLLVSQPSGSGGGIDPNAEGAFQWIAAYKESYADEDLLTQANDWSGNAYHFTQTVPSWRPTFDTNVLNGQPGYLFGKGGIGNLFFDRSAQYLQGMTACELMVVVKTPTTSQVGNGWQKFDSTSFASHLFFLQDLWYDATFASSRVLVNNTSRATFNAGAIYHVVQPGAAGGNDWKLYLNGNNLQAAQTSPISYPDYAANNTARVIFGNSGDSPIGNTTNQFDGWIMEWKLWNTVRSNAQRNASLALLSARYGISVTNF